MKGLELSEKYYKEYGEKMLDENFSHIKQYLAVGLMGSGSECLGYDDEISRDHDFEPGFCIFLPDESLVSSRDEFLLERAYAKLPKEFMGVSRNTLTPVGERRHGVIRIADFLKNKTGSESGEITKEGWFFISEQFLLEVTNGKLFCDNYGLMTRVRENLSYLPEDARRKKLAGNLLLMGQSGQYNYPRCVKRQETGAAALSAAEFVSAAMKVVFLLNKAYIPYYKWSFRAMRELNLLSELEESLEYLISSGNGEKESERNTAVIESIAQTITEELKKQELTDVSSLNLEAHAYSVNNKIADGEIRNLNILYAV